MTKHRTSRSLVVRPSRLRFAEHLTMAGLVFDGEFSLAILRCSPRLRRASKDAHRDQHWIGGIA